MKELSNEAIERVSNAREVDQFDTRREIVGIEWYSRK